MNGTGWTRRAPSETMFAMRRGCTQCLYNAHALRSTSYRLLQVTGSRYIALDASAWVRSTGALATSTNSPGDQPGTQYDDEDTMPHSVGLSRFSGLRVAVMRQDRPAAHDSAAAAPRDRPQQSDDETSAGTPLTRCGPQLCCMQALQEWEAVTGAAGAKLAQPAAQVGYAAVDWKHVLGWPAHRTLPPAYHECLQFKRHHPEKLIGYRSSTSQSVQFMGVDAVIVSELLGGSMKASSSAEYATFMFGWMSEAQGSVALLCCMLVCTILVTGPCAMAECLLGVCLFQLL
jgi:hypothetical protein